MTAPATVTPGRETIPDALKEMDTWICWLYECRECGYRDTEGLDECTECGDDISKIPYNPSNGHRAKANDPGTGTGFDTAWPYYTAEDVDGVGIILTADDPIVAVDLDDCRDPEGPTVDEWAREIVEELDTYAEVSPSGTGIHAYARGDLPEGGNKKGDVEMYDDVKYLTVTGEHLGMTPWSINDRQDALESVHAEHIADHADHQNISDSDSRNNLTVAFDGPDDELIETAKNAANGDKFARLWNGDTSGYPSHSEADQALCNLLAFYTGPDPERIDRLFRRSGLVRDKWTDRKDYRDRTIENALDGKTEFYPGTEGDDGAAPEADLGPYEKAKKNHDASTIPGKAYAAWSVLKDDLDIISAEPAGTLYSYRGGVWETDGKQVLREAAEDLMGIDYGTKVLKELVERVRATRAVHIDELGTPRRTVAVGNGLLDLETRDLRPLEPDDHAIAQLPVEYDPETACSRWREFIGESVEADRIDAVQEYVGYTLLTGEIPFARVLLLVGGGSNGKTTFLNVVTALLGPDNTTGFSLDELVGSEYYVAEMYGAIANIDADVAGSLGYARKFKQLTGGDRKVSARRPYGEPFDYHPTTKHLYAANEVPHTKVDDTAFFRRWLIAEFPTTFTDPDLAGPDKNPDLEAELLEELSGILNWALDGLDRLLEQGYFTNEGTTEEKRRRWQSWGDTVQRFIAECITAEGDEKHRTSDVYEMYTGWCSQHGETAESQATLTRELKKLDGVRYSTTYRFDGKQERGFKGLTITADAPPPTDTDVTGQRTITQDAAVRQVRETVREMADAADGDGAPIDAVAEALDGDLGDRDPRHIIENGLASGEFYQPSDGTVRPT